MSESDGRDEVGRFAPGNKPSPARDLGNRRALKDGFGAVLAHRETAAAYAEFMRQHMPAHEEAFEPAIALTALMLAQLLGSQDPELGSNRSKDWNTKAAQCFRMLTALGLTPIGAARFLRSVSAGELSAEELMAARVKRQRAENRYATGGKGGYK